MPAGNLFIVLLIFSKYLETEGGFRDSQKVLSYDFWRFRESGQTSSR